MVNVLLFNAIKLLEVFRRGEIQGNSGVRRRLVPEI